MGKFINTAQKQNIDSLIDGFKDRIKNPYYIYTDKKPTPCIYYNQNQEKSTLDQSSKLQYDTFGGQSPTYYNRIEDFYLYGMDKIMINLQNGEFGLEADSIEGEAVLLPNTIEPYSGDYFSISYLDKKVLFRVTATNVDTLENGANMYKISYKLDQTDDTVLDDKIADNYNMVINNVGTKFNTIIKSDDYVLVEQLDDMLVRLKKYYKALFYNTRVQTFTFLFDDKNFYDPCLIEFLIRNKLMDGDGEYIYITHQTAVPDTFILDYDKTLFRYIETTDKNNILSAKIQSVGDIIDGPLNIFYNRMEEYFQVDYNIIQGMFKNILPNFNEDFVRAIYDNALYTDDNIFYNIIIKYFNNVNISKEDIDSLEKIDYNNNITLFYIIPILIYCLEYYIKNLLK